MRLFVAAFAGGLFGIGLVMSGMVDPQIVLGFFDLAGSWNPQLAFVMAGAVPVMAIAWRLRAGMSAAYAGGTLPGPASTTIDARLLGGSALFGLGWGITGLCPAPSLAALGLAGEPFWAFVIAMCCGLYLPTLFERMKTASA
jgi:uncharacterized membrane protein YedE/YeeE